MTEKIFIKPDDLLLDAFTLARQVYDSGFIPEVLVVLWRGGTPVGIVLHEFLLYKGIETYHTALKAESYTGIEKRIDVRIEHMEALLKVVKPGSNVLIIDDIFDTGCTMKKVKDLLEPKTTHIKLATLYYKQGTNLVDLAPDFYARETAEWIVFPHELMDLSPADLVQKDPRIAEIVED